MLAPRVRCDVSTVSYRAGGLERACRWAGLSAISATVLFFVANALWALDQPRPGVSGTEALDFYADASGRITAGGLLSLVSIAIFVVFASALRRVLAELDRDDLLANVAFAGVLVAMAAGVGAETINMAAAVRAGDDALTEPVAVALFETSYVLGYNAAGVGLGLFALATGAVALRARVLLPRWLAVAALVLGACLLTPLSQYLLALAFVLILVLGFVLLRGSAARDRHAGP